MGTGWHRTPPSGFQASVGRLWEALRHKASGPFYTEPRDERKSRIKAGVAGGSSGRSHLPAVRAVTWLWGVSKVGSKTGGGDHACGHNPQTPTVTTKKQGSSLRKEQFMGRKEKFAFYLSPEKKAILERRYRED